MSLKLLVKGNQVVIKGLEKYGEQVLADVTDELITWALKTSTEAKRDVPVDTSALKNSIDFDGDGLNWTVSAGGGSVDYAPYVEFGTGALVNVPTGLENYAIQFKGKGIKQVNLPARTYLFANARKNFEEAVKNIKNILAKG